MKSDSYFMEYAYKISLQSTCYNSQRGAIIVKNNEIISSGFNNVPYGSESCNSKYGCCYRRKLGHLTGEGLCYCRGIHAEASAIGCAAKNGVSIENAILYTTHLPCNECAKLISCSGISKVVYSEMYYNDNILELFSWAKIHIEQLKIQKT